MDFIKNALREFKHVVWPTREETKKYFSIVLLVLISFGVYLFVFGNIFSEILFGLKNMVNPSSSSTTGEVQLPEGLEGLGDITVTTSDGETINAETTTSSETIGTENNEEAITEEPVADEVVLDTEIQ